MYLPSLSPENAQLEFQLSDSLLHPVSLGDSDDISQCCRIRLSYPLNDQNTAVQHVPAGTALAFLLLTQQHIIWAILSQ